MGKLLRVLSVLLLLLSAGALTLGSLLFAKREMLKGRTQKLEKSVIQLSAFIEAERDTEEQVADFPAKDIDEVSAQIIAQPVRSDFWDSYKLGLEEPDRPSVVIKLEELMKYYAYDPITLKVMKDAMGYPVTSGKGTMQAVLDSLLSAAESQLTTLNETRHELRKVREELVATIEDLNRNKNTLREKLVHITELNATIAGLEDNVRRLEGRVSDLEDIKRELEDTVASQERKIEELNNEILLRDETIKTLKDRIKEITDQQGGLQMGSSTMIERLVEAGVKGKVVSVNDEWGYAVIELNDRFLGELEAIQETMKKNEIAGSVPSIELFVKRGKDFKTFVSKIRLVQVKRDDKLGIANILVDWQQLPLNKGDVVFF